LLSNFYTYKESLKSQLKSAPIQGFHLIRVQMETACRCSRIVAYGKLAATSHDGVMTYIPARTFFPWVLKKAKRLLVAQAQD
jgi:hypothetical protein